MDVQEALQAMERYQGRFPRAAVHIAMTHREEVTPHLLETLRWAVDHIEAVEADPDYMAHVLAFYLLAQFRETRAYPLIIEYLSMPGEIVSDTLGDVLTEDIGRILASVSGGDIEPLKALYENPEAHEYARGAALDAMVVLVVEGVKTREEIMAYFRELFEGRLPREGENPLIWSMLVATTADLYPEELTNEIRRAYADDLVEEDYMYLHEVEEVLVEGKAAALRDLHRNPHHHFVKDTVREISRWYAWDEPESRNLLF